MLEEAGRIAAKLDDPFEIAWSMHARAKALALSDREQASALNLRALEALQGLGNERAQAQVLFSLSVGHGTDDEKRAYALEAARLQRSLGDHRSAGRSMMIASLNGEGLPPAEQERVLLDGLADAQTCGDHSTECTCYFRLARVAALAGDQAAAEKYRRWANEMQSADGMTPRERAKQRREFAREMTVLAKVFGSKALAAAFTPKPLRSGRKGSTRENRLKSSRAIA
jgi:hypothetical protein